MRAPRRSDAGDLSSLEARLLSRFDKLDPDEVRHCLSDSVAQFEDARIRTFLAVLIERAATERLRGLERAVGTVDAQLGTERQRATEIPRPRDTTRERDSSRVVRAGHGVVPALGG